MRLRYRRCHYQCHHERTTRLGRLPGNSATLPLTPHGVVRHTDHHSSAALALRARGVEARQQWVRGSIVRDLQPPVERGVSRSSGQGGHLAFRTRPPLENEAEEKFKVFESRGDVDQGVVTTATGAGAEEPAKVEFCAGITPPPIQTGPPWSGPTLTHKTFVCDLAFGPDIGNEEVYQRTVVANELLNMAPSGGTACILAYGQTWSGKTYTMDALEHRVARDLFEVARVIARQFREAEQRGSGSTVDTAEGDNEEGMFEFNASFLELLGKRAVDLLQPTDGFPLDSRGNPVRTEVAIQENKVILVVSLSCPQAGEVRPRVIDSVFHSSKELETLITTALSHRRTSATARNAASSRSHAILTIRVKNKLLPYADEGQLILVDLAGSERYEDSKEHDKQRMLESRENKSLMNLKECVRPKAKMANEEGSVHIPWRMNKFPMLLKPIFDVESRQASKTLIIAHASPHIQDSMHSVNTLSYASPFKTSPPAPYDPADPRTWDHDHTMQWLTAEYTKRARRRQAAAYKVKEKEAERRGEKLRPLDPNAPVQLAVHVDGLCPGDMTAGYFGRMHTAEFVQRCLEVANLGEEVTTDVVRNVSVEVVGALYYLMLSAKTKTQNEIMKSRKKLEVAVNGEMPERTISSTDPDVSDVVIPGYSDLGIYSDKEILNTVKRLGQSWFQTIDIAASEANTEAAEDESLTKVDKAKVDAIKKMMEAFRIEEAQTTAQSVHFCSVSRDYCIISGFTGFCKRLERELQRTPSLILRDESRK